MRWLLIAALVVVTACSKKDAPKRREGIPAVTERAEDQHRAIQIADALLGKLAPKIAETVERYDLAGLNTILVEISAATPEARRLIVVNFDDVVAQVPPGGLLDPVATNDLWQAALLSWSPDRPVPLLGAPFFDDWLFAIPLRPQSGGVYLLFTLDVGSSE